jgi:RimJ/RimL family protein N-acetyltransferase
MPTEMEDQALTIRPLSAPDAGAFRQIRLQAIADAPSAVWPTYEEEARRTVSENEARIQQTDKQVVFGAFVGTKLVGIAGLRREPLEQVKHKAVLWGVFVSPDVRARNLYLALGFKPFGLEPRAMRVGSQYFDEEHMVLRLDD